MIVGHPEVLAIESRITLAYSEPGLRALGCFTLLIQGRRFGVYEDDATMLANSFDEVCRRIDRRGRHRARFGADISAHEIASSIANILYDDLPAEAKLLGMRNDELADLVHGSRLIWAPDGDAAFDDRSHVLHIDIDDQVRLIAFRRGDEGLLDPSTLVDQWLPIDEFYSVLEEWRDRFILEWECHPKVQSVI